MVKPEILRPNANHTPAIPRTATVSLQAESVDNGSQQDDPDHDRGKHSFCSQTETLLYPPEAIDTDCLSADAQQKEIR